MKCISLYAGKAGVVLVSGSLQFSCTGYKTDDRLFKRSFKP